MNCYCTHQYVWNSTSTWSLHDVEWSIYITAFPNPTRATFHPYTSQPIHREYMPLYSTIIMSTSPVELQSVYQETNFEKKMNTHWKVQTLSSWLVYYRGLIVCDTQTHCAFDCAIIENCQGQKNFSSRTYLDFNIRPGWKYSVFVWGFEIYTGIKLHRTFRVFPSICKLH